LRASAVGFTKHGDIIDSSKKKHIHEHLTRDVMKVMIGVLALISLFLICNCCRMFGVFDAPKRKKTKTEVDKENNIAL
jgi:hypothetical protein